MANELIFDGLPITTEQLTLPHGSDGGMVCRCLPEPTFLVLLSGGCELQANGESLLLAPEHGAFLNAGCLHTLWASEPCEVLFVSFSPALVCGEGNSSLAQQYATPILTNARFARCVLTPYAPAHAELLRLTCLIAELGHTRPAYYELQMLGAACLLWAQLCTLHSALLRSGVKLPLPPRGLARVRQAIEYIHAHYPEKLSLDSIAEACGVSKSECCRQFQRMLRQTPFDYLLRYRVHKSLPLLFEGALSITEIAWITGFTGASYFSEIFRRYYGCSPTEYRKLSGFLST